MPLHGMAGCVWVKLECVKLPRLLIVVCLHHIAFFVVTFRKKKKKNCLFEPEAVPKVPKRFFREKGGFCHTENPVVHIKCILVRGNGIHQLIAHCDTLSISNCFAFSIKELNSFNSLGV